MYILIVFYFKLGFSQKFTRSELITGLSAPWEIMYGPDGYLWMTESGGRVSRVDPANGTRTIVYQAQDYFGGSALEQLQGCHMPNIGAGTFGMAIHPEFILGSPYVYFFYSYNKGSESSPATRFKVVRLTWNSESKSIVAATNLIQDLPNGYDHFGGRMMIIPQGGVYYLFLTIGDHGISEENSPTCYNPQTLNPNNQTQNPLYMNGKVHRFLLDGTVPSNNPIPGNSFYTRGHRNPQGLMYNTKEQVIYSIEHGDRTDDEINVLSAGKNYGWKQVRGYSSDNNFPGETNFAQSYTPHPMIPNDGLVEPIFSWCSVSQPSVLAYLDWCTVAPSDGIYYSSSAIPDWNNSLLVVTLKNGSLTDNQVYRFKLTDNGQSIVPSNATQTNPSTFFKEDQHLNGRLRDICVSPDGKRLFLINNGGTDSDKIIVYTLVEEPLLPVNFNLTFAPNPFAKTFTISCSENLTNVKVLNELGQIIKEYFPLNKEIEILVENQGFFLVSCMTESGQTFSKKLIGL